VEAAHWVPIAEARVYVNGELTHTLSITSPGNRDVVLSFAADCFVTVEVEGSAGPIYRAVAPGFTPFAFTNPIFVDADGDGAWTPPGLPDDLPESIRKPFAALKPARIN
jgi:hypothetical protein